MKYITTILVGLLIIPSVSFASFDRSLSYGSVGASVIELQEFLSAHGYTVPITGNFYSLTLASVKQFQSDHGLPNTGYFGVLSRGVANSMLTEQLLGSTNEQVLEATTTPIAPILPQDPIVSAPPPSAFVEQIYTPITTSTVPISTTTQQVIIQTQMNPLTLYWLSIDSGVLHISSDEELDISKMILPQDVTISNIEQDNVQTSYSKDGKLMRDGHGYGIKLNGLPAEFSNIDVTLVGKSGSQITQSVIVR